MPNTRRKGLRNYRSYDRLPEIAVSIPSYKTDSPPLRFRRKTNAPTWFRPDELAKDGAPDTDRQDWLGKVLADIARAQGSASIPWAFRTRDEHGLHWFDAGAAAFLSSGLENERLANFAVDQNGVITEVILTSRFWESLKRDGLPLPRFVIESAEARPPNNPTDNESTQIAADHQRNPPWTRDELILALELYLRNPAALPGKRSPDVIELSRLLNKLGRMLGHGDTATFRNSNGVYMKLMNFRRFDPAYTATGKVGLARGNRDEETVWNDFSQRWEYLREVAAAIRSTVDAGPGRAAALADTDEDSFEALEGRVLSRLHRERERCTKLIELRKAKALKLTGRLQCQVCEFDFEQRYGERGRHFIECHHTKPIHTRAKEGEKTALEDLALVCANCHRMIHAGRSWLSIDELKRLLRRVRRIKYATVR